MENASPPPPPPSALLVGRGGGTLAGKAVCAKQFFRKSSVYFLPLSDVLTNCKNSVCVYLILKNGGQEGDRERERERRAERERHNVLTWCQHSMQTVVECGMVSWARAVTLLAPEAARYHGSCCVEHDANPYW